VSAMGLKSVFRFGKYKGLTVAAVIRFNPGYLAWMLKNIDGADFDAEARKAGQQALNEEREQSMQRQNGWAWGFGAEVRAAATSYRHATIQIEHEERRKAGQTPCPACFPSAHRECPDCGGVGWIAQPTAQAKAGQPA
jgi:hypothetical protein